MAHLVLTINSCEALGSVDHGLAGEPGGFLEQQGFVMENAQLITLSRLKTLGRQMDIVANNMANVNTTGFKSEHLLFEDYLSPTASAESFKRGDRDVHFVIDDRSVGNFNQGTIQTTNNKLDVAIHGEGFFAVQTPGGERYTRNGAFTLNAEGQLTNHDGHLVLGEGDQPIIFDDDDVSITINGDGTISSPNGELGKIKVVKFADNEVLERQGANLFKGDGAELIETPHLAQFAIENSNVNAVTQISEMIEIQRSYDSVAGLMKQQNDLRENAIQRLGRVQVNA